MGLLLAMGLTKAEVVDALTKHMMNAAVSEQEQQEATELLVEVQDWGDDEADACNKFKKLHDSLRGQTRNIFWAVRALHKQQQVAAQQQAAPGPSQQQAAPGSPQATSGNTFRIVIGAGFTVVVVCTVGLTATIIDAINFGKDYVARHDPTFKAAVGGVGVARSVKCSGSRNRPGGQVLSPSCRHSDSHQEAFQQRSETLQGPALSADVHNHHNHDWFTSDVKWCSKCPTP